MATIRDLLMERAEALPERVALWVREGRGMTYRELSDAVHAVGKLLPDCEEVPRVATVVSAGIPAAVSFLAGACFGTVVPLNPGCRARELETYLSDCAPHMLWVEEGLETPARDVSAALGIPVAEIPADISRWTQRSMDDERSAGERNPEDTALLLWTSGTTSQPKRVPLSHANLLASAGNVARSLRLEPDDCCLNPMPLFHIHGLVAGLLAVVHSGGSVLPLWGASPETLLDAIHSRRPTWYTGVPTMHQAILDEAWNIGGISRHRLRLIRSSSAPLSPALLSEMESAFGSPVVEAYGMTEAAHQVSANPLPPDVRVPGSVGRPTGVEVRILAPDLTDAERGTAGEVVLRGTSIMAGYDADPSVNREAFHDGWFRTGDAGYLDDEGYLFLTGRIKEMVNRGGEKIAPREIDEALLEHDAVAQAVAFAVPHPTLGEDLAVAVVLKRAGGSTEGALRAYLLERLAEFKVPSRLVFVESIPEGPTGKPQRIGLAELLSERLTPSYTPPETPFEIELASIWADVLPVERVGRDDNFFAIGGDSLSAARVLSRVVKRFGSRVGLRQMFEAPVLKEQAIRILLDVVESAEGSADEDAASSLEI